MQKSVILFAMVTLLAITACEKKFDIEAEKETLKTLHEEFYNSLYKGDIEVPKKLLAQDWEFFLTTEDYQGRISKEGWLKSFDETFKPAGNVKITVNNIKWIVSPTIAISKSDGTWLFNIHTQPIKFHFFTTVVYEKRNGNWFGIHVHQSFLP